MRLRRALFASPTKVIDTRKAVLQKQGFVLVVLLACIVRLAAAMNDFWLDEIWSYNIARQIDSMWGLIFTAHHDNNHILNTLYLYLLGDQYNWLWYRLLSIVTGTAVVVLIGRLACFHSLFEEGLVVWLTAISFPLIVYSSEARGYAPAVFFAVLSFLLIEKRPNTLTMICFWLAVFLGALSHLTYCFIYLAILLMSFFSTVKRNGLSSRSFAILMKWHGPPLFFLMFLYLVHVRHLIMGGWEVFSLPEVLDQTALLALGLPAGYFPDFLGIGIFCVLTGLGLFFLWRVGDDRWVFFLLAIIAAPALSIIVLRPQYLCPRYFLVCFPFFYLLLGRVLAKMHQDGGKAGRRFAIAMLVVFSIGHLSMSMNFLVFGRGGSLAALNYMAEQNNGPDIFVGSDNDFRIPKVLAFYMRYLPKEYKVIYFDRENWPKGGPTWLVLHNTDPKHQPKTRLHDREGHRTFRLEKTYPYGGVSGWNWYLYRIES
ncbi:MAG: hypothetical protein KKE17_00450 [Proteobacteria bacterium]|nr:hypothetical protein [Pseudomonadota bacterium]MBU1708451.1 hypothetical protein [Pseudomonadota bacterium]